MRTYSLHKYLILLTNLLLWTGCSDSDVVDTTSNWERPNEIELTLRLPQPTVVQTRATSDKTADESKINHLSVISYKSDGTFLNKEDLTSDQINNANAATHKIRIGVPREAETIHLVTNVAATQWPATIGQLSDCYFTDHQTDFVMWGKFTVNDLLPQASPKVSLYHNVAKITLQLADALSFIMDDWSVVGTAAKGSIAPKGYNISSSTPQNATDETFEKEAQLTASDPVDVTRPVYIYESAASKSRLLIKGRLNDASEPSYYTAAFLGVDGKEIALLRNHYYQATIIAIDHAGYATRDEAIKAKACNIRVLIKDHNPSIVDMVACGSYELGVCDTIRCEFGNDENVDITNVTKPATFFTSYEGISDTENNRPYRIAWDKTQYDWIESVTQDGDPVPAETGNLSEPKGQLYSLLVTLHENNMSDQPRRGKITITSGDLNRDLWIVQQGKDFKRSRQTMLVGLDETEINYWDLIDGINTFETNGDLGVTADMMQVSRNQGLHFSVQENTYWYKIPKETSIGNDLLPVIDDGSNWFKITGEGDYWKVELTDNAASEEPLIGSFHITTDVTEADAKDIITHYEVYRTGLFHKTETTHQVGDAITGWRYYEQVKLQNNLCILDRNIGASCNRFYAPDVAEFSTYQSAVGAHFRITDSKDYAKYISDICPKGYTLPSISAWMNAGSTGIELTPSVTAGGESYISAQLKSKSTDLPWIYFPFGGYTEGSTLKNSDNGYYWSSTFLAGNQGFSSSSPEYGFWYRCMNLNRGNIAETNVRFVGGSNGGSTDVYKGLSMRCVKEGDKIDPNLLIIDNHSGTDMEYVFIYIYNTEIDYENIKQDTGIYGVKVYLTNNRGLYYTLSTDEFPESMRDAFVYKIYNMSGSEMAYTRTGNTFTLNEVNNKVTIIDDTGWPNKMNYIYMWDKTDSSNPIKIYGDWPGKQMTEVGSWNSDNTQFTFKLPDSYPTNGNGGIIFLYWNNTEALHQTSDIFAITGPGTYRLYTNGSSVLIEKKQ